MESERKNITLLLPKMYKFVEHYFKKKVSDIIEIESIDLKIDYAFLDKEEMLVYLRALTKVYFTIKLEVFSNFRFVIKAFVHYTYKEKDNEEELDIDIKDIDVEKLD